MIRRIRNVSFVPGSPLSWTSIRKTNEPEPLMVAVPKMLALVWSAEQLTARMSIEWTFRFAAGP